MEHDICLNIHYSAPDEVWEKIGSVYLSMPYWAENNIISPCWKGDNIELFACAEPGGIQICGTMPEGIWEDWIKMLKSKLTQALGYEIGEPENGFPFKYWEPFEKKHSDIKSIDGKMVVFNDESTFYWEQFDCSERDITAKPPYFLFRSDYIELYMFFDKSLPKSKLSRQFNDFRKQLDSFGIRTLDLS